MRDCKGRFVKGFHSSAKTEFKKGQNLGKNHPLWKGGKYKTKSGYIMSYVPNHPKACNNRIYEHRLIIEQKLGHYLELNEMVHHINGIRDDNRIENLIVLKKSQHHSLHAKNVRSDKWKKSISKSLMGHKVSKKTREKIKEKLKQNG